MRLLTPEQFNEGKSGAVIVRGRYTNSSNIGLCLYASDGKTYTITKNSKRMKEGYITINTKIKGSILEDVVCFLIEDLWQEKNEKGEPEIVAKLKPKWKELTMTEYYRH